MKKDPRHRAREAALQILYQWEIGKSDVDRAIATFFDFQWADAQPPADAFREFASTLALDTVKRLDEIDALIAGSAENWRPERMAVIDRLIIRMAVCEFAAIVSGKRKFSQPPKGPLALTSLYPLLRMAPIPVVGNSRAATPT